MWLVFRLLMVSIKELYSLEHTLAATYLNQYTYPWEALKGIKDMIIELGSALSKDEYDEVSEHVWVHKSALICKSAYIGAPCIIGPKSEVRHCSFIRGSVLIGANCVVGNSTEVKNAILFDGVEVPHFNYVGDSILGYKSHMGAGSVTSNIKLDRSPIMIDGIDTGLIKIGAMLGDNVEVGCNTVLNPGTVVGPSTSIYPLSNLRGVVPSNSVYKSDNTIVTKR